MVLRPATSQIFGKFLRIISIFLLCRKKLTRTVQLRHSFVQDSAFTTTQGYKQDRARIMLTLRQDCRESAFSLGKAHDCTGFKMGRETAFHDYRPEGPSAA